MSHGPWCADVLLRSGAFGLVVLDGGGMLPRGVAVRLTRLARESNAAFVMLRDEEGDDGGRGLVGGAVRLRVCARRRRDASARDASARDASARDASGRRLEGERATTSDGGGGALRTSLVLQVTVEKGGTHHVVEVGCAIEVARRMCAHSQVPDRRGVAARNRRGERATPDAPGVRRTASPPDGTGGRGGTSAHAAGAVPRASGATLAHKRRCAEPAIARDEFLLGPRHGMGSGGSTANLPRPLPAPPPDARRKPQRPEPGHRA